MLMSIICIFLNLLMLIQALQTRGSGMWSVIDVGQCDAEVENVVLGLRVEMYKANHTHIAYRGQFNATNDIDDTFELLINVCKHVDGGCKHYATIVGGMEELLYKHSKNNMERLLTSAGIDPPEFPVPQGYYSVEDFILDFCELPTIGCAYGKYEAEVFFVKDEEKVGCLMVVLEYLEPEEEGLCEA